MPAGVSATIRLLLTLAHWARRRTFAVFRVRTRGAKVAAYDANGRLLLVRNTYGRTDWWALPGGGVARREQFLDAAVRELCEETGLTLQDAVPFAVYTSTAEGKRDTIALFRGRVSGSPTIDPLEIAEARFFALDALPKELSPSTRRRIAELSGAVAPNGAW